MAILVRDQVGITEQRVEPMSLIRQHRFFTLELIFDNFLLFDVVYPLLRLLLNITRLI